MDLAIAFAVDSVTSPYPKCTVYSRTYNIGLSDAHMAVLPSMSRLRLVTRSLYISLPQGSMMSTLTYLSFAFGVGLSSSGSASEVPSCPS